MIIHLPRCIVEEKIRREFTNFNKKYLPNRSLEVFLVLGKKIYTILLLFVYTDAQFRSIYTTKSAGAIQMPPYSFDVLQMNKPLKVKKLRNLHLVCSQSIPLEIHASS